MAVQVALIFAVRAFGHLVAGDDAGEIIGAEKPRAGAAPEALQAVFPAGLIFFRLEIADIVSADVRSLVCRAGITDTVPVTV
jgi:hypothetical protein